MTTLFIDVPEGFDPPELQAKPGDVIVLVVKRNGVDVEGGVIVERIEGRRIYFTEGPTIQ